VSVLERGWHAAHQSVACESTRHLYSHKGTWLCDTSIVSRWQAEHTVSAKLDLLGMVPALRCAPGTVLRVCWVAVPKAMRARRANSHRVIAGSIGWLTGWLAWLTADCACLSSELGAEERRALAARLQSVTFEPGRTIIEQGAGADCMYIVQVGAAVLRSVHLLRSMT
jgi:hypothetical protein